MAGILILTVLVVGAVAIDSANQRLVDQGVRVPGVVTTVSPNTKYQSGSVKVSYAAGQRRLTGRVDLGSRVTRFAVGQKVDVYYDRHSPTRMTIIGVNNQPAWSVWLMVLLIVVAVFVILTAVVRTWGDLRSRRILAGNPWREVHAYIAMDDANRVVAKISGPTSQDIYRSPSISVRLRGLPPKLGVWRTGTLWIARGSGRHAVLALPMGGHLLQLRSPRTDVQRRLWSLWV
ncbi:MAG TPA: DUF3592 domain-containing protein [Actinoallomurus sp.]|nr:DUF3592 domain-containing protein [Actinoallomurus sp.]